MPYRNSDYWILILAFVGLIGGMLGGAAVGSSHLLQRKFERAAYLFAYLVIGAALGTAVVVLAPWVPGVTIEDFGGALAYGLAASVIGVSVLAAGNVSVAFLFEKLGVRVDVHIQHKDRAWNNKRKDEP